MIKRIIILILIFVSWPLLGQKSLLLDDAIQLALNNNFDIQLSKKDVDISENNNTWGNAGALPKLSLQGNTIFNFSLTDNPASFVAGRLNTWSYGPKIQADWLLFGGFKARISKHILERNAGNSKIINELEVETVLMATITSYYQILLLKEQLGVLLAQSSYSRKSLADATYKFDNGHIDGYSFYQVEQDALRDSTKVQMARLNLTTAINDFKQIAAVKKEVRISFSGNIPEEFPAYKLDELEELSLKNNKRILLEQAYIDLEKEQLQLSKAQRSPELLFTGLGDYNRVNVAHNTLGSGRAQGLKFFAGLTLNFNLWNGGTIQNKVRESSIRLERQTLEFDKSRFELKNRLSDSFQSYESLKKVFETNKRMAASSMELLKRAQSKFESGLISSLELQQVENMYLNAQHSMIETQFDLVQTELDLVRMSGGILRFKN